MYRVRLGLGTRVSARFNLYEAGKEAIDLLGSHEKSQVENVSSVLVLCDIFFVDLQVMMLNYSHLFAEQYGMLS